MKDKIKQYKKEFKTLSEENNLFYTYLSFYLSASVFCFFLIFTRSFLQPALLSVFFFFCVSYFMRKIYKNQEAIYVSEEIGKYKNRL